MRSSDEMWHESVSAVSQLAARSLAERKYVDAERYLQMRIDALRRQGKEIADSVWQLLGIVYYRQGNFERSQECYQEILKKGAADPAVLNAMGLSLCAQGKHDLAKSYCAMASIMRDKSQDDELSINDVADIYCWQGDYDSARPLCEAALLAAESKLTEL